ncbi:MAG: DUF1285 domain-containing protein [Roseovarius sp.]
MSAEKITTPSTESLAEAARQAMGKSLPPVQDWHPPLSGEIDIVIARDGTWYHEGSKMTRRGLVALFSSILRKEGERYYLVTPVEKWALRVEDAPFVAVDVEAEGEGRAQVIAFETNVGDKVLAGATNPIRVERDAETGEPSPYVMVRDGLEALIDRKSFYRMVELGAHEDGWFGLWSDGAFFRILRSEEMEGA